MLITIVFFCHIFTFKVIVTNLHPVVTGEDIEELFGNIGPIKYARLIREGIAEVLFHEKVDAYR